MRTKKEVKKKERPVLVTTAYRGVFFGYASDTGDVIELKRAQLVIRWSSDLRGFMGLASHGPSSSCTIGRPADIELRGITSVVECAQAAVDKFAKFARKE
jgi:hypothetical protein